MDEATRLLETIKSSPHHDASAELNAFQQRPNLLDFVLPDLIEILTHDFLESRNFSSLHTVYVISRVRGYKHVIPHLPVRIDLVLLILETLEACPVNSDWQSEYILLLWASCLVLAPFNLAMLGGGKQNILQQISLICTPYLSISGIQRDAAALLMARIFTRDRSLESNQALTIFFDSRANEVSLFGKMGTLQVLAAVMDRVREIPNCVASLISDICGDNATDAASYLEPFASSPLIQVLWTKIVGRSAILNPEDYAEFAIATCLDILSNKSSKLRMSAAKYLGRIAKQISHTFKDESETQFEAIEQIWNAIYEPMYESNDLTLASSDYWGGALFALAEVIRCLPVVFWDTLKGRSLLNDFIFQILQNTSLHFVQPKIQSQGGSNVRDTACYVSWSIFRYVKNLEQKTRDALLSSLKALSLLDPNIQIRRAAAAALQEGLGRHNQNIAPEEVFRIMENVNFNSVSSVSHCYLEILPDFWEESWVPWFLLHGCYSPDLVVRELAAQTISVIKPGKSRLLENLLNFEPNSVEELDGQCRALYNVIEENEKAFYQNKISSMVRVPDPHESELTYMAMIHLAAIFDESSQKLLREISFEAISQRSLKHNEKFPKRILECAKLFNFSNELVEICFARIDESPFFVQCLNHLNSQSKHFNDIQIARALALKDPESRAIACQMVDYNHEYLLLHALDDYSRDKRGDVGSWIREAALRKLSHSSVSLSHECLLKVWRLAAEGNELVRSAVGTLFANSKDLPDIMTHTHNLQSDGKNNGQNFDSPDEQNTAFFYWLITNCPKSYQRSLISGIITSLGAQASSVTAEACLCAVKKSLPISPWVLEELIRAKREFKSSESRYTINDLIRAFQRLVVSHCPEVLSNKRVLAIAFNATLTRGLSAPVLLDAIDMLGMLSHLDLDKVRTRLLNIIRTSPNGSIRQRAADAVFELDLKFDLDPSEFTSDCAGSNVLHADVLEKRALVCVDWKRPDWREYTKYLK